MREPQPLAAWLIPFVLLASVGMMMLVSTLIAALGGWSGLARLYREPGGMRRRPARSFFMATLDLRGGSFLPIPAQYSNCVSVDLAPDGLHLRMMFPFRFSHPPLLIPWERIERYDAGRFLFWRTLTVHPRGTSTRIRLWGRAARGVEEAARQIAAHSARPARV
jgi:hypothetical protein